MRVIRRLVTQEPTKDVLAFMKSNLERGFWRLALGFSCFWWAIGQFMFLLWDINSYPFIRLTIEFEDFF